MLTPSHVKRKRRRSTRKTEVAPIQKKPQLSGSCENKSHQLWLNDFLTRSGCKKKREKRSSRQFLLKESSQNSPHPANDSSLKSLCTIRSSLISWKFRKKKSLLTRSPTLKESVSWASALKEALLYLCMGPQQCFSFQDPWIKLSFRPGVCRWMSTSMEILESAPPGIQWIHLQSALILFIVNCIADWYLCTVTSGCVYTCVSRNYLQPLESDPVSSTTISSRGAR